MDYTFYLYIYSGTFEGITAEAYIYNRIKGAYRIRKSGKGIYQFFS